jgi:hypothetical protein
MNQNDGMRLLHLRLLTREHTGDAPRLWVAT